MTLFKILSTVSPIENHKNRGFTLIEIMVVVMILGILASLAIPSFVAMNNRSKLNSGLIDLSTSLQEVQRTSIRTSKSCTLTFPASGSINPIINSSCLIAGNLPLDSFKIRNDITSVIFNYQGNTATSTTTKGTIILSLVGDKDQKCLVISPGIGLIRTGNYDPTDATGTDPNKCTAPQ
jgi:prepilin-type N-terminal cleavage/methylation domain-containing protein